MVAGASNGPGLTISISYAGQAGPLTIQRKLATFGMQVRDLSPAWQEIGEQLQRSWATNFASEGGAFGNWSKWVPLAPATQRERARLGYGAAHPILQRTGALYLSVTQRGAADNVFVVKPMGLQIGSTLFYASFHQSGAVHMPKRQIIGLTSAELGYKGADKSIIGILDGYLAKLLAQANLTARGFTPVE